MFHFGTIFTRQFKFYPHRLTFSCIRYLKMVSDFLEKNNFFPLSTLVDLHAWFPAETPEPPVEVSHGDDLGKYLVHLS